MVDFEGDPFEVTVHVEMLDPLCQSFDKLFGGVAGRNLEQVLSPFHDTVVCVVNKLHEFFATDTVN